MPSDATRRIAVIGGGVSGLSAAYLLSRPSIQSSTSSPGQNEKVQKAQIVHATDAARAVTLFESCDVLGGHALTVHSPTANGEVDLGFQVFNLTTYPHLVGLFGALGVESERSDMSFSCSSGDVEWGSIGLKGVFAQKKNARSARFLKMIREILRFGKSAPEVLDEKRATEFEDVSLGEYLERNRYSTFFKDHYVVPMCAAIWSCSDEDAMAFPVKTLVRFWVNHHLLNVIERPLWRVVKGRSSAYVDAIERELDDVRKGAYVKAVKRTSNGKSVIVTYAQKDAKGKTREHSEVFDDVVFACHSDQVLTIMGESAYKDEIEALSAVKYQENEVYLHTDATLMPRSRDAWASWNCLRGDRLDIPEEEAKTRSVCVTYWVNLLQNLAPGTKDLFVTLNPPRPPREGSVEHKVTLAHPLFNKAAIAAQTQIQALQGKDRVWFCGAWCGYGFHEDGIKSAVDCCDKLLGRSSVPWIPRPCNPKLSSTTKAVLPLFQRACTGWLPANKRLRMILPDGSERMMCGKDAGDSSETITMTVFNQRVFVQTILRADIGLGECYMNGDFDADLIGLLDTVCKGHPGASGVDTLSCKPKMRFDPVGLITEAVNWVGAKMEMAAHKALSNTKEGSRKNIEYHYDAGNDFYKLWLDRTMLYSSAIHGDIDDANMSVDVLDKFETFEAREKHLEAAQYTKIDAIIDRADIQSGHRVLEIGCGWGTCAIRMVQRKKCHVTGLTLSHEQHAEATARVKAAGLAHMIDIVICDYRDVKGTFDRVVSIEMLEAVGHEHLPTYFSTVHRVLKPGGKASIQVITMPDGRYDAYCNSESDFIRAYIFPGGHLPSVAAMRDASPRGLVLSSYDDIGLHYAVTLRLWRERMMHHAERILSMGYTRKFLRMFEFYFAYCEAAFANKLIYDLQMTWTKVSEDVNITKVQRSFAIRPYLFDAGIIGAGCAIYYQHQPKTAAALADAAVPLMAAFVATFGLVWILAMMALTVFPKFKLGKKVSKVKLDEASTAHGTLSSRALELSRLLMKAIVSAAIGSAACAFIADAPDITLKSASWMLPVVENRKTRKAASDLLIKYVVVSFARGVTSIARRKRFSMMKHCVELMTTLYAIHHDLFVVALAFSLVIEVRVFATHFRVFARVASGFPHYETFAYSASRTLATLALYAFQIAPTLLAGRALALHINSDVIDPSSGTGIAVSVAICVAVASAGRVYVQDVQHAVAERKIRDRILSVATSADI